MLKLLPLEGVLAVQSSLVDTRFVTGVSRLRAVGGAFALVLTLLLARNADASTVSVSVAVEQVARHAITIPTAAPGGNGTPVSVHEFALLRIAGSLAIQVTPTPPTSGWWQDPHETAHVPLKVADLASLGLPQGTTEIELSITKDQNPHQFCTALDFTCGSYSALNCDDSLTDKQRALLDGSPPAIPPAVVYLVVGKQLVQVPRENGEFPANDACNAGSLANVSTAWLQEAGAVGVRTVKIQKKDTKSSATDTSSLSQEKASSPPKSLSGKCNLRSSSKDADVVYNEAAQAQDENSSLLIISYDHVTLKRQSDVDDRYVLIRSLFLDCAKTGQDDPAGGYANAPSVCRDPRPSRTQKRNYRGWLVSSGLMRPDQPLTVLVIHDDDVDANVASSQPQGLTSLGVVPGNGVLSLGGGSGTGGGKDTGAGPGGGQVSSLRAREQSAINVEGSDGGAIQGDPDANSDDCVVDRYQLAPRPSGPFTVTAQLLDPGGELVPGSVRQVEMIVDTVYVGALRVGLGASFPAYGVRSFSARTVSDGTNRIYQDTFAPAAAEVIAGYTTFFTRRYGRSLLTNDESVGNGVLGHTGLFLGIGVVSGSSGSTVNVLTSAYAGIEVTFYQSITLELLPLGARRDTILASGYNVGSVLPSGASAPTTSRVDYSPAIALSVDADIFKIAGVGTP